MKFPLSNRPKYKLHQLWENTYIIYLSHIIKCPSFFRLLVRQSGKLLHVVSRLQFVDSPEWFGVVADDLFQVRNFQKNMFNLMWTVNDFFWPIKAFNDAIFKR